MQCLDVLKCSRWNLPGLPHAYTWLSLQTKDDWTNTFPSLMVHPYSFPRYTFWPEVARPLGSGRSGQTNDTQTSQHIDWTGLKAHSVKFHWSIHKFMWPVLPSRYKAVIKTMECQFKRGSSQDSNAESPSCWSLLFIIGTIAGTMILGTS